MFGTTLPEWGKEERRNYGFRLRYRDSEIGFAPAQSEWGRQDARAHLLMI